jgi:hypothetical protein
MWGQNAAALVLPSVVAFVQTFVGMGIGGWMAKTIPPYNK